MKANKEWFIDAPWGKIASLILSRIHFVAPMDVVVKKLGWKQFICLSHSAGGAVALYYNAIRPNLISKFIFIDVEVSFIADVCLRMAKFYQSTYGVYFDNYRSFNNDDRIYSKRKAVNAMIKARGLTEEQAEVALSRNLNKIGEDQYRLSWHKHLNITTNMNMPTDDVIKLYSKNLPPTLFIQVTSSREKYDYDKYGVTSFIEEFEKRIKFFEKVTVEGNHDIHLTNPRSVASYICEFLKSDIVQSKL